MVAITTTGALYAWGTNAVGQLGDNTSVSKSSPIQIGTSSWSVVSVSAQSHMTAIDSTGRLFAWGFGQSGRLGDGTNTTRSSPVQIGAAGFSYTLVSSYAHSIAQTTFGNLYGWGDVNGSIGGIGDGILNPNVPTLTNTYVTNIKNAKGIGWKDFNTLGGIYYGIDSTDSLYAWGTNTNNSLGFNAYGTRATPDIVNIAGSNLNIVDVAMGNNTTIAITTDNETNSYLYAWGNNAVGQYGDGSTVTRSSPVLVTQLATGYTANLFSGGSGSNFRR
jgi:alpha-tubulin suppressor-like RCC1 family protein